MGNKSNIFKIVDFVQMLKELLQKVLQKIMSFSLIFKL